MTFGPFTFDRKQLHELVWTTPMIRLSRQFGLSDNGLRKICRRLEVPCPPAGWWARKAAGMKVVAAPLPSPRSGTPLEVVITATPDHTGELRQAIESRAAAIGIVKVPQRLARPHPVIAGWIDVHRARMKDAQRHRAQWPGSRFTPPDLTDADRRRNRLLHALFRALEQNGVEIIEDDRRHLLAKLCEEKIEFSLREKSRQVTRPLTADEERWGFWDKSGVRRELEPTGRLEFRIRVWIDQPIRKTWLETDRKLLDEMLPEIAATFLELAPVLAERSRKTAEQSRILAERQRQLELERQLREQDDRRWKRFIQVATDWQRVEQGRAFLDRLRTLDLPESALIDGRSLTEWLEWAETRADASDPLRHGLADLFGDIAAVNAWTRLD